MKPICSTVRGLGLTIVILAGLTGCSDAPKPVSTMQNETTVSGDPVQERGINRMPVGGMTTGPMKDMDPVGFQCSAKTRTCSCRKSTPGDCDLMKAIACGGGFDCPGSSQTCTCKALR